MRILGLTIGTASIGWALLDDKKIVAQGVRAFPTGTTGDIESGRDTSNNQARQDARQRRVQLRRRAGRLKCLFRLLQEAGWLPQGTDRHTILEGLKSSPYALRTKALDEELEPYDLGRAIYHLAHRRGFKSGQRRTSDETAKSAKDKELSIVKQAILDLEAAILASGARTLGEHLNQQPTQRRRWTGRAMYVTELDAILTSQARFRIIPPNLRNEIAKVVFDQKPLRSQKGRVGRCSLERSRRRMALAHPRAQEFRVWQQVNDLRAVDDLGADTVVLSLAIRQRLAEYLHANGDATFAEIRKVLGLPKTVRFNFERAGKKTLVGDRTRQAVVAKHPDQAVVGEYPDGFVEDLLSITEEAGLTKRLVGHWNLSPTVATDLATAKLEQGYLMHSHKAVARLLPLMRNGLAYTTAVKQLYNRVLPRPKERLPFVSDAYPYLANPLVSRALSELRKLIHAIIKAYGKPELIRIELHRHLQMGPKSRKSTSKNMWARQDLKKKAAKRLVDESGLGIKDPISWQVDRVLLADECGWTCRVTGKQINWRSLMLDELVFPVAHIVPFGMSLDDGWSNKMLVHASVLERRGTSLFSEMFPDNDGAIAARFKESNESVKKNEKKGKGGKKTVKRNSIGEEKLRRFQLTREEAVQEYGDTFAERFVESSSYAARTAAEYLARLGVRVEATRGRVSSFVREATGLARLRRENLGDYRYHVLDAISVALTNASTVRALCAAAKTGERRRFAAFQEPWPGFVENATSAMHATVVSHRVKRSVRGAQHKETNLGYPKTDVKGTYHLLRKPLADITKSDISLIAAPRAREAVLKALGSNDPKKWFADPQNLPIFNGKPMRRVRVVRRGNSSFLVGDRYVVTEKNHHLLVYSNGKKWDRKIVSLYEAQQRLAKKKQGPRRGELSSDPPIYQEGLLTIAIGEIFAIKNNSGEEDLIRIRGANEDPRVEYVKIHDCRTREEAEIGRESVDQLRKREIRKVHVDVIGRVRRSGQKK
jgi:CRISPR-associated endonuclease Csn1